MPNNPLLYDLAATALVSAVIATANGGSLRIFTGAQPALNASLSGTLLVTLPLSATAFAAAVASAGTVMATANPVTAGTAGNTGTAGYFALLTSGSAVVVTGTAGMGAGFDLAMGTTSIPAGAMITINALKFAWPQT